MSVKTFMHASSSKKRLENGFSLLLLLSVLMGVVGYRASAAMISGHRATTTPSEKVLQTRTGLTIAQANDWSSVANRVLELTNYHRQQNGLRPLQFHNSLNKAAQAHSNDIGARNVLSHKGSDGSSSRDRARRYGFQGGYTAENVSSRKTPDEVVTGWMNSPGHRNNILNPKYRYMGIGYSKGKWTQTFGG
ncbi:MAG: CAP domain-containing protein [Leptolyngbyaceae cyanobacterium bins.349]|nr:CAP domain-containing protein [Leptolyngbyaceae cyanobacterium bins.349]